MIAKHRAVACALITGLSATTAHASPKKPILVFESYTGDRPGYVGPLISSLDDELEKRGFTARPAAILKIANGRVPHLGVRDKEQSAATVEQTVAEGVKAYADDHFDDAARALTDAIRTIQRNPTLFVQSARNSEIAFRAYATLAIIQSRTGDPAASFATMKELIRSFPARPLSRADYGPDGEQLYRDAVRQVQDLGRGQLRIDAHDPRAVIFVDGQIQGTSKVVLADLIPGACRVFVQIPGTIGHQYKVEISADKSARVDVDPADMWLSTTDQWVGFSFPTDADRGREAIYAGQIARRWTDGDVVAVVGSTKIQGKPALIGSLYQVDGTVRRSAVVSADAADRSALAALAEFLADGTATGKIQVVQIGSSAGKLPAISPSTRHRISRPALFWTGIGVLAAGAASGVLSLEFASDAATAGRELQATCAISCTSDQERSLAAKQDAANLGTAITAVVGGVAVATSAILIVVSLRRRSAGVNLVPLRGGAAASYTVEF